jgi:hypothetical protein
MLVDAHEALVGQHYIVGTKQENTAKVVALTLAMNEVLTIVEHTKSLTASLEGTLLFLKGAFKEGEAGQVVRDLVAAWTVTGLDVGVLDQLRGLLLDVRRSLEGEPFPRQGDA